MSFTKQFIVQDEIPLNRPSPEETVDENGFPAPTPEDYQATFAAAIGLTAAGVVEVVIDDMKRMIQKGQRNSLQGYIQCLYRIISRKVAWQCIYDAYKQEGESVPANVRNLFEKSKEDTPPEKPSIMTAE